MRIRRATCVALCFLAACHDAPVTPAATHPSTGSGKRPLGLVEVTISGLGSKTPSASVRAKDFVPPDGASGEGGIQIAPVSTGTFTVGARGAGGMRYFYATYQVRNANISGTAYTTPRTNLTFLAVGTNGTIGGSAISQLFRFDGSLANTAIAAQVTPTGMAHQNGGAGFVSSKPDVLQALSEADVAAIAAPAGVTTIFPYAFVTSNPNTSNSRTLPANPAVGQFDGLVTFAFKYPLQATAADDPFTLSMIFLALDDSQTRVTQSLEEQDAAGTTAFEARATALGATSVTLLAGGTYAGAASTRTICSARVAGTAASPTAYAFGAPAHFLSLTPNPYDVSGESISSTASLTATFDTVVTNATPSTFVVDGMQSGRGFLGHTYTGNGTTTVSTPNGSFLPGEEVEVTVAATPGLACPTPWAGRLRVGPTVSSEFGSFAAATTISTAAGPYAPVLADLNGDGKPDLIVTSDSSATVAVFLNNGSGGFGPETDYPVGSVSRGVAVGDFNGDGKLDIVVANRTSNSVSVLLGNGDGTFQPRVDYPTGSNPQNVVVGDFNRDGKLDLAVGTTGVSVLLGNGDGTFQPKVDYPATVGSHRVVVADFNQDGTLDLAVSNANTAVVDVYLGKGDGTFNTAVSYAASTVSQDITVGDFDGNGTPDLIVTYGSSNTNIGAFLNNGDGTFQPGVDIPVGGTQNSLIAGDFDGDGHLDLALTLANSAAVPLEGPLGPPTTLPLPAIGQGIVTGDINADGKLDLIVANFGNRTISLIRRN
ncbi:MAG TPA: VCBS repeat-containing protein [Gemmatimonadaceae bacterium]|nr:VCBS repeat-containing protein [Gemmatimonadaceae bacterium]